MLGDGGIGSYHLSATGDAFGTGPAAPGTNSLGTALSSDGVGNGAQKGPPLGTSPAIDHGEAKVDKMIGRSAGAADPVSHDRSTRRLSIPKALERLFRSLQVRVSVRPPIKLGHSQRGQRAPSPRTAFACFKTKVGLILHLALC
jgi:hypothetical protein